MASVAILFPSKSLTELIGESSGTAKTHLTGRKPCLAYISSSTSSTSAPFSIIQSLPVIPTSKTPSSTKMAISCALNNMTSISGSSTVGK